MLPADRPTPPKKYSRPTRRNPAIRPSIIAALSLLGNAGERELARARDAECGSGKRKFATRDKDAQTLITGSSSIVTDAQATYPSKLGDLSQFRTIVVDTKS